MRVRGLNQSRIARHPTANIASPDGHDLNKKKNKLCSRVLTQLSPRAPLPTPPALSPRFPCMDCFVSMLRVRERATLCSVCDACVAAKGKNKNRSPRHPLCPLCLSFFGSQFSHKSERTRRHHASRSIAATTCGTACSCSSLHHWLSRWVVGAMELVRSKRKLFGSEAYPSLLPHLFVESVIKDPLFLPLRAPLVCRHRVDHGQGDPVGYHHAGMAAERHHLGGNHQRFPTAVVRRGVGVVGVAVASGCCLGLELLPDAPSCTHRPQTSPPPPLPLAASPPTPRATCPCTARPMRMLRQLAAKTQQGLRSSPPLHRFVCSVLVSCLCCVFPGRRVAFGVSRSGSMLDSLVALADPAAMTAHFYTTDSGVHAAPTLVRPLSRGGSAGGGG